MGTTGVWRNEGARAEGHSVGNRGCVRTAVKCGDVSSWILAGKHGCSLTRIFFLAVGAGN